MRRGVHSLPPVYETLMVTGAVSEGGSSDGFTRVGEAIPDRPDVENASSSTASGPHQRNSQLRGRELVTGTTSIPHSRASVLPEQGGTPLHYEEYC